MIKKTNILISIFLFIFVGLSTSSLMFAASIDAAKPTIVFGDDINYPPYSYLDEDGNPTGFNIELAEALGAEMGYNVEIRLDDWTNIRRALETGEIDAIMGMIYSFQRVNLYDFTVRHSISSADIFARGTLELERIEDLRGKTVVVQKSDIVGEYLLGLNLDIKLVEVLSVREMLMSLEEGRYDYAGLLKLPGLYIIKENNFKNIYPQNLNLNPKDYSMAVKKGNENLLLTLNSGLKILKATGKYDEIFDKWLSVYEEKSLLGIIKEYTLLLTAIGSILFGLILINFTLRHIVNLRTKELRDSEQNLRNSMKRNRAILDAFPDLLFTISGDGKFLNCQVGDESLLLMPKEAFLGKTFSEVLPLEVEHLAYENLQKAITEEKLQRFEYELDINGTREIFEMRFKKSSENEVIGISRKVTSEKIYHEHIEYLSYHDHLTGLYNRRYFEEELFRLDVKRNFPLCIIMGDLNGLKLVNDSFGHQMGDKLLIKVAEILKKASREDEIIARIGGDEFVILIPKMENNQADLLVNRIQTLAENEKIGSVNLSISFGWDVKVNEEEDIQDILGRAENFMYKKKLFEGPSMRGKTIAAIINTLNEKNKREELHSRRVSEISCKFAVALGFSDQEFDEIKTIGLLHDIGKIGINEALLNKPGKLTNLEFDEIKRHPEIGHRILSMVNDMTDIANAVLYHHERWDGFGYPTGLSKEDIPIQSRIICIVDAYDAMTSERSYRNGMTKSDAIMELRNCAGHQFDPELIEIFIKEVLALDV